MEGYDTPYEEKEGECLVCGCPMEKNGICSDDCLKADML